MSPGAPGIRSREAAELTAVGVIPARLGSTRLARKVLREIAGVPMVVRVWEGARGARGLAEVIVATDAPEVAELCASRGIPVRLTSSAHQSGTDRVWEVAQAVPADVYVNIQGDEPLVAPAHMEALLAPFHADPATQVTTLCIRAAPDEIPDSNAVKVVRDAAGGALYFSRHAIPFVRGEGGPGHYKHLGLYAFRRDALERFHALLPTPLERAERLEQLRLLEHGIPIVVVETDIPTVSVDTEEDLRRVEAILADRR